MNSDCVRAVSWKIFEIQSSLISVNSNENDLNVGILWLCPYHYDEIIEERANDGICGYPSCKNKLHVKSSNLTETYRIDYHKKQIFQVKESKFYCSDICIEKSSIYKQTLSTSDPIYREIAKTTRDDNNQEIMNIDHVLEKININNQTNSESNVRSDDIPKETVEEDSYMNFLPQPPPFDNPLLTKAGGISKKKDSTKKENESNKSSHSLFRDPPRKLNLTKNKLPQNSGKPQTNSIMKAHVQERQPEQVQPIVNLNTSYESVAFQEDKEKIASNFGLNDMNHPTLRPVFAPSSSHQPPVEPAKVRYVESDNSFEQKPSLSILNILERSQKSNPSENASVSLDTILNEDVSAEKLCPPVDSPFKYPPRQPKKALNVASSPAVFLEADYEEYPEWFNHHNKS